MSERYKKEIEDILNEAGDIAPGPRSKPGLPRMLWAQAVRSVSGKPWSISPGRVMIAAIALLVAGVLLRQPSRERPERCSGPPSSSSSSATRSSSSAHRKWAHRNPARNAGAASPSSTTKTPGGTGYAAESSSPEPPESPAAVIPANAGIHPPLGNSLSRSLAAS